jgi:PAS domain S-box-containing protein
MAVGKKKKTTKATFQKRSVISLTGEMSIHSLLAPDIICTARDGKFLEINPACIQILGYSPAEMMDMGFTDLIHPDDLSATQSAAAVLYEGKTLRHFVNRYRHKKGHYVPLEWSAVLHAESDTMYCIARNMSHEQAVRDAQILQQRNIDALINNSFDLIWSVDTEMRFTVANNAVFDRTLASYGFRPKVGDKAVHAKLPREVQKHWKTLYGRALSGESFVIETRGPEVETENFVVFETSMRPIMVGDKVHGVVCMARDITAKKKLETALFEESKRLNEAQHVAKIGSWHYDLLTGKLEWSEAMYPIFGLDPKTIKITPETFYAFIHPDDLPEFKRLQQVSITKGKDKDFTHRIVLPDGTEKYIHQIGRSNYDKKRKLISLSGTMQDVTRETLLHRALTAANERFNAVARTAEEAIYDWDILADCLHWEPAYYTMFGGAPGKNPMTIKQWEKKVHPDDAAATTENLYKTLENKRKKEWKCAYRYKKTDGSYAFINEYGHIFRDKTGRAIRMVGCLRDVTETTEMRRQLEISEKKYRDIFEMNPYPMWVYDLETLRFMAVNKAAVKHYGYRHKEFLDMTIADIRPSTEKAKLMEAVERVRRGERLYHAGRYVHRKKNGEIIQVEIRSNPIVYGGRAADLVVAIDITEELSRIQLIEAVNRRLVNAERLGGIGYYERDLITDKVYWSDGIYHMLGLDEGHNLPSLELFAARIHKDDRDKFLDAYWRSRNEESGMYLEHRIAYKGGSEKTVFNTGNVVKDQDGNPLRYEGIIQDITRRKRMEQALREANEKLSAAQQIAGLGYWVFDLQTQTAELSDSVYDIWELEREGRKPDFFTYLRSIYPKDRLLFTAPLSVQFAENDYREVEHRIVTKRGVQKWIFQRIHLIRNHSGKPLRLESVMQDVTVTKQRDLDLRMSNHRFEMAMRVTNEMIWDWDIQSDSVIRSDGFQQVFGYPINEETLQESFWQQRVHPEDTKKVASTLKAAMKDRHMSEWNLEYRFLRADNSVAYVRDRGIILRDESGKVVRMVGSVLDITEEKAHLEKIEKQNTTLRKIAWIQSHDVRAPLANIMGLVELLQHFPQKPEEQAELLKSIHTAARSLDAVIHEISEKAEFIRNEEQ